MEEKTMSDSDERTTAVQRSDERSTPQPAELLRQARDALAGLLSRDTRNTCQHENTHRGGVLWTICDDCDAKWADDRGGMPEWKDPPEWVRADEAIAALDAALAAVPAAAQEPMDAYCYARRLAQSLFDKHYAQDEHYASGSVKFALWDDLMGVLTQIDNMVSGLSRAALQSPTSAAQEPTQREQTLAGLLKRCARCLPPDHATRKLATDYLKREGFFNVLRAAQEPTRQGEWAHQCKSAGRLLLIPHGEMCDRCGKDSQ
jgi:hypothetical protein